VQACGFRDDAKKLADKGAEVIGVSGDTVKNHQLFKKLKKLPYTLLADEKGEVAKKFGVPTRPGGVFPYKVKDKEGNEIVVQLKRGVTMSRWTFVIGKDGKILHKDTAAKPGKDSKTVLEVIEKQGKE
jgi:peroxiredoxin Q/BCP